MTNKSTPTPTIDSFIIDDPDHQITHLKGVNIDDIRINIIKYGSIATYLRAKFLNADDTINILHENGFQLTLYDEIMYRIKNDKHMEGHSPTLVKLRYLLPVVCGTVVIYDKNLTGFNSNWTCLKVFYFDQEWNENDFKMWLDSCYRYPYKYDQCSLFGTLKMKKHSIRNLIDRVLPKIQYKLTNGSLIINLNTIQM